MFSWSRMLSLELEPESRARRLMADDPPKKKTGLVGPASHSDWW
jgi:hypothetical protein